MRATNPDDLKAMGPEPDDVWDKNIMALRHMASEAKTVVAAWGNHGLLEDRAKRVMQALPDVNWTCLDVTLKGMPKHPLYVRGDTPLKVYRG